MQKIKNDREICFMILHNWFHWNHMVLNADNNEIAISNEERLLGIVLDSKLTSILILHVFVKKQVKNLVLLQE